MIARDILALALRAKEAGIGELEWGDQDESVKLRIELGPVQAGRGPTLEPVVSHSPALGGVRAPGVGILRHAHPVTGQALVAAGQRVQQGQLVAYLEVGPCLRGVTAPADGTIGAPALEDGAVVGYGALLYPLS